ncbi:3570_t:CDS:2, partial [Funneliformis mosseae]
APGCDTCSVNPKAPGCDTCSVNPKAPGCDACSNNPQAPGCAAKTPENCDVNPYGPGCNVDCGKTPAPSGCANVPDCGNNSGAVGCNGDKLDCGKYPSAPNCGIKAPVDCSKTPNAPGCVDCSKTPDAPGCTDCSKTPDAPVCLQCTQNPYGSGCGNVDCKLTPEAPGCSNIPNCESSPNAVGCIYGQLDCAKYPKAPECINKKPDCFNNPNLPGCNDCNNNPYAFGCDVCSQVPQPERCQVGYCDKNPGLPECAVSLTDSITIYAIEREFILVTYYCNPAVNNDVCGKMINWEGTVFSEIYFEKSCTDGKIFESINVKGGFLHICYKSETKEAVWTTFGAPNKKGEVNVITTNKITEVYTFDANYTHVFEKEDGGYCVVTSKSADGSATFSVPWNILVTFIPKDSTSGTSGPYEIYKETSTTVVELHIYKCNIAYQSSGYSCIIKTVDGGQTTFTEIDFLGTGSNGKVTKTQKYTVPQITAEKVVTDVESLAYGGYVIVTKDSITGKNNGYVVNNEGVYNETINWGLSDKDSYVDVIVLPNNTIVGIPNDSLKVGTTGNSGESITIASTDDLTNYSTVEGGDGTAPGGPGGYGSSKILSTTPGKGSTVPLGTKQAEEFTITYGIPVVFSTGNFSVYQVNGTDVVLKQAVSAKDEQYVTVQENIVTVKILKSTLNTYNAPNVPYYVEVDNDFVMEKSNGQNVIGIRPKIWNFTATNSMAYPAGGSADSASAIIRLSVNGTKLYKSSSSEDKKTFVNTMSEEISRAISCEPGRLTTTKKYQYDAETKEDQFIMRVDIKKAASFEQASSDQLIDSLDDVVRNKAHNSLSDGDSASYIDESNGAPRTENLNKYKFILIGFFILLFILIGLVFWARKKYKNGRNFLAIFCLAFIPIDLILDIAFILDNDNEALKVWKNNHPIVANVFLASSIIDTDALQEVSSKAGGIPTLSAPYSVKAQRLILISTGFVAVFEDFPQFVFYSVYLSKYVKPAIVPILVLSSCIIVLFLKFSALIFYTCCYKNGRKPSDKEKVINDDSSSSSSSSDSGSKEHNYAPDNADTGRINEKTDTANVPPTKGNYSPSDGPSGKSNKPTGSARGNPEQPVESFGNVKPVENRTINPISAEKEPITSSAHNENNKKGRFSTLISGIKKSKKEEDISNTTNIEVTKDTTTSDTTLKPVIDSTNRDSTNRDSSIENYNNFTNYLNTTEGAKSDGDNLAGASNSTVLGFGQETIISKESNTENDLKKVATGVGIAGAAAATTKYVTSSTTSTDEAEKDGFTKTVTTTATTTSDGGVEHITRVISGEEYVTTEEEYIITSTGERGYITKLTGEDGDKEYFITATGGRKYIITTTIGDHGAKEYFITSTGERIYLIITTGDDDGDKVYYITSTGERRYIIITTSVEEYIIKSTGERGFITKITGDDGEKVYFITYTGERKYIITITIDDHGVEEYFITSTKERLYLFTTTSDDYEKEEYIEGDGKYITTTTATTGGKIIEGGKTTKTTYITSGGGGDSREHTSISSSRIPMRKQARKQNESISESTDADGITTITKIVTTTEENGEKTVTKTITKKDQSGREISSSSSTNVTNIAVNDETEEYITNVIEEGEGSEVITTSTTSGGETRTITTTSSTGGVAGASIIETQQTNNEKKTSSADKYSTSLTASNDNSISSARSIKRTSSYGRSGGKISKGTKKSKATTASKVNRSGDEDKLGRVNSVDSVSSMSSSDSTE